ncbi:hypothetical protein RJ640_003531 [Escallonia rubra]|uniref:Transcriptional coactivator Hfi1/Transcriptional adapter 1 n=1 Tax=Escallonia rubra TaxID=112253 RepID=A0AA88RE82_9ASTE|nr:hypothetical protein RJ640_003531 [Escallonia rubra]
MQPRGRIDVADLKAQIAKKLGPERSKRYFYYLNRPLSQKVCKVEFDRFCFRLLGRENLPLHNLFIRSILKNACRGKAPPPVYQVGPGKSAIVAAKSPATEDGYGQSKTVIPNQTPSTRVWSNGVVPPLSPRKGRSTIRDRKFKDRPSYLGLNGKTESVSHHSTATEDGGLKAVVENGNSTPCDFQRPVQHTERRAEQSDNERERVLKSTDCLHTKEQIQGVFVDDGEEVEQANCSNISRSSLIAPLGIPLCSASVGWARKVLPPSSTTDVISSFDSGGLLDSVMLQKRMEQIASAQGLRGVSMECASTLNTMLDVYVKRLIRSCIELVGARSGHEPKKHPADKQQLQTKLLNGMWPSNHLHMQNRHPEVLQEERPCSSISLLDFKVAMELNPQQLGEDWPLMLEKISMQAFEE